MYLSKKYKAHYKTNLKLALPVMMSQLGHVMVGVVDSLMVGRLGEIPLAASSLANSVFFFFICFGIGVSYGITPLVAQLDNTGSNGEETSLLKNSLVINIIIAIVIFLLVVFMSHNLSYLGQNELVVVETIPYLFTIALSIVPFMVFQTFRQYVEGLSYTKQAMFIIVGSNLINIILNYFLIFGKWGFPQLGLEGAGIATLISRVFMLILIIILVNKHKVMKKHIVGFWSAKINKLDIKKLLDIGVPSGLQFSFEVSAFTVAAIMMGWLGSAPLSAHQIAISVATVSYMMASGLATASTIRVGNQLGKKDFVTLRDAVYSILIMVIAFELIWTMVFILGRNFLPSLYIDDIEVLRIASRLMVLAAFFQLSDGIQVVGLGALRGMQDTKLPTWYTLIAYWVIGLPVGYLLAFQYNLGGDGIWIGLIIGLTLAAVALIIRFNNLSKKLLQ